MDQAKNRKVYIVGAGLSGKVLASEILARGTFGEVVAFIDDDIEKIGREIDGK